VAFLPALSRWHRHAIESLGWIGRKLCDRLFGAIDAMIDQDFAGRILPFDSSAARYYAEIAAARRGASKSIMDADCQIAAVSRACGAEVATRNAKDFENCAIELINPWDTECV